MRYWHPHSSEKHLIEDWDAFWTEGRSDNGTPACVVVCADPEFGDKSMCLCRNSDEARFIAACVNKAREYDKIIDLLKLRMTDDKRIDGLNAALDFAMEERP